MGRGLLLLASGAAFFFAGLAQAAEPSATFQGASEALFSRPHDLVLAPDGRHLYLADLGHDAVQVLDPDSLAVLGHFGTDQLADPHDVAFDQQGRLLVADTGNDRIALYQVEGAQAVLVGELSERLSAPEGVAVGPDGRVYVANARSHEIVVFQDGQVVAVAGGAGSEPNRYQRPHDIHVAPEGRVIVADPGNNRLQILSQDLEYRSALGGAALDFNEPKYFDLDGRGWLFVADEYNHVIKLLDPAGRLVLVIGAGRPGEGADLFNYPEGVEVSGDRLWIADTRNHRVVRYQLDGLP